MLITKQSLPSNSAELESRISTLRSRGVDVIVLGVGNVNVNELRQITGDVNRIEDKVLLSKYVDGILQYSQDISDFACSEGNVFDMNFLL